MFLGVGEQEFFLKHHAAYPIDEGGCAADSEVLQVFMTARVVGAWVAADAEIERLSMNGESLIECGEEYVSLSPKML